METGDAGMMAAATGAAGAGSMISGIVSGTGSATGSTRGACSACGACPALRRLRRQGEKKHARLVFAEALERDTDGRFPGACRRLHAPGFRHSEIGDAQGRQRRRARKPRLRRRIGMDERAVGRESSDCIAIVGKEPPHPLAQRQHRAGRFGRDDEHGGSPVIAHDPRADAGERATEAGAEAAQPLEPLLRSRRQRRAKPDDLSRRRIACLEMALAQRAHGRGAEDRGADGIGPKECATRRRSIATPARRWSQAPRAAGHATERALNPQSACDRTRYPKGILNKAGRGRRVHAERRPAAGLGKVLAR